MMAVVGLERQDRIILPVSMPMRAGAFFLVSWSARWRFYVWLTRCMVNRACMDLFGTFDYTTACLAGLYRDMRT